MLCPPAKEKVEMRVRGCGDDGKGRGRRVEIRVEIGVEMRVEIGVEMRVEIRVEIRVEMRVEIGVEIR